MPGPNDRARWLDRVGEYARAVIEGSLAFLAIGSVIVLAYVYTQGRGFLVPMTWSNLGLPFLRLIFMTAFAPFMVLHVIARVLKVTITPVSAAVAGSTLGGLAGWTYCGRQACFASNGALPLLGWYIVAIAMLAALFHEANARHRGV